MKRATAIASRRLSPACAGSHLKTAYIPGANAPGFTLTPASQAEKHIFHRTNAYRLLRYTLNIPAPAFCLLLMSPISCLLVLAQSAQQAAPKAPAERSKYKLNLKLDFDSRSYSGSQRVRWINRGDRSTNSLYFHLYSNLRLDKQPIQPANSSASGPSEPDEPQIEITEVRSSLTEAKLPHSLEDQGSTLRVHLREAVLPGASTEVIIGFKGTVPEIDAEETGITTHVIKQISAALRDEREIRRPRDVNFRCRGVMLLATSYPALAVYDGSEWRRRIDPSVGDMIFNEVADYEVAIETAPGVVVFTSGQHTSESQNVYSGSAMRDFAIVASRNLRAEQTVVGGTRLQSVFLPEHERTGKRVLATAAKALEVFAERFGPPPFKTITVAEVPLVAGLGSTEFTGLNVVASAFYVDFDSPSMRNLPEIIREQRPSVEESLEWTVSHLVAQQWWGVAVGNDPAREPVLDEGLSSWSALLYYNQVHNEEHAKAVLNDQLVGVYRVYRTFGGDDMDANRPAREYRNSLQYVAIVSTKGALMFAELERMLGEKRFFAALQSYYQANLYEIAELEDLRGAFIAEAPIEQRRAVARTFNRWLASRRGDEDIAKPDQELAKSLGLPPGVTKDRDGDRNALNAFARVGKFFWQQMTRIR
ncbi:MAG TPA: M1 family aminopeptidase [Pyrinomonadaceae bacterium]|nr:M1 family aminopeptidase [Pyrinomonadaceae bacterium]